MEPRETSPTGMRTIRAAGVAGLLFSGLLTTSLILFRSSPAIDPDPTANGGASDAWGVALYLVPFSGIAFLWFLAVVRLRIGRREDQFFSTVFLGSGLLFIAMLFAADAVAGGVVAMAQAGAQATDPAYAFGRALAATLFFVFAVKMAAVFMLVSSNIGRRTGFLPRWFVVVGILAAAVMLLSVGFFQPLALIFPAWVAVVSVLLLRAHPASWDAG
ncbi:MAG TPA: hypothetical protein VGQ31_01875 [Candidatus Limnocylindrales bacterium]|nr:hypothetical protein [Candidatus Limnocylindrales bacterium]